MIRIDICVSSTASIAVYLMLKNYHNSLKKKLYWKITCEKIVKVKKIGTAQASSKGHKRDISIFFN